MKIVLDQTDLVIKPMYTIALACDGDNTDNLARSLTVNDMLELYSAIDDNSVEA